MLLRAALALAPLLGGTTMATAAGLDAFRWDRRVVVAIAPAGDPAGLIRAQRAVFDEDPGGMLERDLVLVEVEGDAVAVRGASAPGGLDADALRRDLGVGAGEAAAVLVGKDGGAKLRREGAPLDARTLHATIDAMPMRRREAAGG